MHKARFHLRIPEYRWIGEFSRAYPGMTVRLYSSLEVESRVVNLGTMTVREPDEALASLESMETITAVQVLERADETVFLRCETTETGLHRFLERSALPPDYPIYVQGGWAELDLAGTREDIDAVQAMLDDHDVTYEVLSLVRVEDRTGLLTDRQRDVLRTALREGYLEVPRDCTLEDVAAVHDIDAATASEILRRGQTKILKWHLTGSDRLLGRFEDG